MITVGAGQTAVSGGDFKPATVADVRPATAAEWDAAWAACGHATYFQSRAWFEDWATYTRGAMAPRPVTVRFDDGCRVVLPIARQRHHRVLGSRYFLSPAGTYGGWLGDETLGAGHAVALADWLLSARLPLWWRINPFDPGAADLAVGAVENDVTHVLHLDSGLDAVCDRATHGHACAIRKAQRKGLRVRLADCPQDWEQYYKAYEASLARWGDTASSRYGAELFELLRRRGSPGIELWLATLDDATIIAGGLCLYAPRHVSYWHAAALSEFFALRPANLLVHEMVFDACARGLRWFDLNPSGGHEGVRTFKERVGAVAVPSPVVVRDRAAVPFRRLGNAIHGLSRGRSVQVPKHSLQG